MPQQLEDCSIDKAIPYQERSRFVSGSEVILKIQYLIMGLVCWKIIYPLANERRFAWFNNFFLSKNLNLAYLSVARWSG